MEKAKYYPMSQPLLSVIIPVFNGLSYTQKCLNSLEDLREKAHLPASSLQIVVVDDGSKDGTSDYVKEHYPTVHLVQGDGTLWWSGGINKGVEYALGQLKTDYILWWNNDVLPADDYLQQLFLLLKETPPDVVIGSKVFILNEKRIWGMGGKFDPVKGTRFMYGERQVDNGAFQQPMEVDWFPGMGTTMHRSVYEKIGYLDEVNFPQYHGDSDFTFRAKKAGFKLVAYPQLVMYNDNTNTGLSHKGSFTNLHKSLTSIKSNYNVHKDILFFKIHATSWWAYRILVRKYFTYIGGFYKWKMLNALGIKKKNDFLNGAR